jgi:hypothetical protein
VVVASRNAERLQAAAGKFGGDRHRDRRHQRRQRR